MADETKTESPTAVALKTMAESAAQVFKTILALKFQLDPKRLKVEIEFTPMDGDQMAIRTNVMLDGNDVPPDMEREITTILRSFGSNAMPVRSA